MAALSDWTASLVPDCPLNEALHIRTNCEGYVGDYFFQVGNRPTKASARK